jgi:hypothetical protein
MTGGQVQHAEQRRSGIYLVTLAKLRDVLSDHLLCGQLCCMDFVLFDVTEMEFAATNSGMICPLPAEGSARFSVLFLCAAKSHPVALLGSVCHRILLV